MKKHLSFSLLVSLLMAFCLSIGTASAQWESSGPEGGIMRYFARAGSTTYAVGFGAANPICSLHKSVNNGASWTKINSSTMPPNVNAIVASGSSLFVGTNSGIFRSDDEGVTWTEKSNVVGIGFLAVNSTYVFAAALNSGILRSADNGETWTLLSAGLTDLWFYSFAVNGSNLFVGTGDNYLGVFRSTDNGDTWSQVSNGLNYFFEGAWYPGLSPTITALGFNGTDIYAGTNDSQGIWKSTDNGDNWTIPDTTTRLYSQILSVSGNGTDLFAGTLGYGVLHSGNDGLNWTITNNGIDVYRYAKSLLMSDTDVFVSTDNGIYKTSDSGNSWVASYSGISILAPTNPAFATIGSDVFYGSGSSGVYRSSDQGANWSRINNGLPANFNFNSLYSTATDLFANNYVSTNGGNSWEPTTCGIWINHGIGKYSCVNVNDGVFEHGLYRSYDNGVTWSLATNGIPSASTQTYASIHSDGSNLFLGVSNGVYHSSDNGDTWIASATPFPNFNLAAFGGAQFVSTPTADIYGLHGGGGVRGIYRSTDNGANWVQVHDLLVHKFVQSGGKLYVSGTNLEWNGTAWIEVLRIMSSQDDGQSWTVISGNINNPVLLSLIAEGPNVYLSVSSVPNYGVFRSSDNGSNWINISEGLPTTLVQDLRISGNKIFAAASGASVWQRNLSDFTAPSQPSAINGSATPCIGSTQTYSVTNVAGVTYAWQLPSGWIITAGGATNSVTVIVGNTAGLILVIPSNAFGTGSAQYTFANPTTNPPTQPSLISGSTTPNEGTIQTYSVTNDPGVTYTWAFPSGWVQTGGGTTNSVTVTVGSGAGNIVVTPSTPCGTGTARTLAVTPVANSKTLTLTSIFPEGLYAGLGTLNQANDELGAHWPAGVADHITVELHDAANYATIAYSAADVPLSTSGAATVTIPSTYNGSYYITIRHRNSLQTVSATAVSFAGGTISQSFGSTADVFGGNLVQMTDLGYAIYSGDVNQDDIIDLGDSAPVDNQAAMAGSGYMPEDVNGDGLVDLSDAAIIDNNAAQAVGAVTP